MRISKDITPSLTGKTTQGQIKDDGATWSDSTASWADAVFDWGGFYGFSDVQPLLSKSSDVIPHMRGDLTQGGSVDDGTTWSSNTATWADSVFDWGGFYGFSDVKPLISRASSPVPSIVGYADIYSPFVPPPPPGANQSVAPGFFMFITH